VSSQDCQYFVDYIGQWFTAYTQYFYTNWAFVDESGISHPLSGQTQSWSGGTQPNTNCSSPPPDIPTATGSATDGSGYTLSISAYTHAVVTTTGGIKVDNASGITITDTNGNKITSDISGHYYDTLSSTTPVLTVSGWNFGYTAPGGAANVTTTYKSYTVKTYFHVTSPSTIAEYGPLAVNLIDHIQLNDGTQYKFTYETTPTACTPLSGTDPANCVTGRIASVTLPTGGQISYTYTGGSNGIFSDGSTSGLSRAVSPGGTWTYARSGSGSNLTTTVTSPSHPAASGTTTDITSLFFVKDTATYNYYETQRQVYHDSQVSTNLLLTTTTCYNNPSSCPQTSVTSPITQVDARMQYPGTNGLQGRTITTYTSSGLLTNISKYQYSTSLPTTIAESTGIGYAVLGNGITDRVSSVSVSDPTATLSSTTYNYDEYSLQAPGATTPQHVAVSGARGNATSIIRTGAPSTTLTQSIHYYDTGTPYTSTDVNGGITTYVYGTGAQGNTTVSCGNSFATEVDLPISGLKTYATWDCNGGVQLTSQDVNGQTRTMAYNDPNFWRPASVTAPYTSTSTTITNLTYTTPNGSTPASIKSLLSFNSNGSVVESLSTLDQWGRAYLSQQREGPSSANYDSLQTNFDNLARPYQKTMFFQQSAGQGTTSTPLTTTIFDALGRTVQTTDAAGGYVKYTYNQNDVLQENGPAPSGENTKKKQLEYDSLGRLTSVCEVTGLSGAASCGQVTAANGYKTTYAYDHLVVSGQFVLRTTVTQNAQTGGTPQTRVYLYDQLGRMVRESNPENGTTIYSFDSGANCTGSYLGDLVQKVDAKGNTTCYTYDAMHRILTVSYSGPDSTNTPTKTFVYDTATVNGVTMTNAKGRLAEAYTGPSGSKITDLGIKYSVRGEILETYESTPHSGGYYHPTATYWENGPMKTLWISQIPAITFGVNGMGRVSTVTATSGQNPVTGTVYDLPNHKTTVTYGSLDSDVFTSDPNTGRMTQYKFNVGGNSLTGNLTWNQNGSLSQLAITDTIPGTSDTQTCSNTHDDLARIATVNCVNGATAKWNQTFSYDAFGNITKTSTGPGIAFTPGYQATTNWITSLPGVTPTTDLNGRMTYDGTHNYGWDVESKMTAVDSTTITYDALGRMVEKNVGGTYTQIVYSPVGKKFTVMSGQTLQKALIPLPGGGTAIYTLSGLTYYRHSDHLGSSRLASTPSRTMYSSASYAPYGEPYAQAGTTDLSFTGQDQDTISGMYDFRDRKYSPVQGRWLSPDPIGLAAVNPASPQSWNRYAYVMNNPLALIDPFGDCDYDECITVYGGDPGGPSLGDLPIDWCIAVCNGGGGGSGDSGGGSGSGSGNGANNNSNSPTVNTDKLSDCLMEQFQTLLVNFISTIGTGRGVPGNTNGSATLLTPIARPITIINDISKGWESAPTRSSAYDNPVLPGGVAGWTYSKTPYTNYTVLGTIDQAAVDTQIWELGNSLDDILRTTPPQKLKDWRSDPGATTLECYLKATGRTEDINWK
jgi:RHS repeat-associated protein